MNKQFHNPKPQAGYGGGYNKSSTAALPQEVLQKIIWEGDSKVLVEEAKKLGEEYARNLATSQIRAIFSEIRQIEGMAQIEEQKDSAFSRLYLLIPKMKYRAGKEKGAVKELVDNVLDPALNLVFTQSNKRDERFKHFTEFFEAILAYHKYYGGK